MQIEAGADRQRRADKLQPEMPLRDGDMAQAIEREAAALQQPVADFAGFFRDVFRGRAGGLIATALKRSR